MTPDRPLQRPRKIPQSSRVFRDFEATRDATVFDSLKKATWVFTFIFSVFAIFNCFGKPFHLHFPLFAIEISLAFYGLLWGVFAHRKAIPVSWANPSATVLTWFIMATIIFATVRLPPYIIQHQIFFLLMCVWAGAVILSARWFWAAVLPPSAVIVGVYFIKLDNIGFVPSFLAVICFLSCAWILQSIRYKYLVRSEHLRHLALSLVKTRTEQDVALEVAQHAAEVFRVAHWALQLKKHTGEYEWLTSKKWASTGDGDRRRCEEIFERVCQHPHEVILPDKQFPCNPRGRGWGWNWPFRKIRTLGIPLANADELRGIAWFSQRGFGKFRLSERQFAETCAAYTRQAMEAIELNKQVERLATVDELTQVFNRRQFFFLADRELRRRGRSFRSLAVVMADIDHFKKINDTWGHPVGDAVLAETARRLKKNIRDMDLLGRYGGEEFCVMLLDTDQRTTEEIAERLRLSIVGTPVSTPEDRITVTISLGVTLRTNDRETSLETLIERADKALYHAKKTGRNRVVFSDGETPTPGIKYKDGSNA